jgi:phospholipid transport system substrate-binding protein
MLACIMLALIAEPAYPADGDPPDAGGEAVEAVRQTLGKAASAVQGEATRNEKLAKLRDLARQLFDGGAMGRRALGDVLDLQTTEQQAAFLELFDDFMIRAYLQKLLFFRNPRFAYAEPEARGEETLVRTRIVTRKDDYFVDYLMHRRDDHWYASDVIVEGISLTENYGAQFRSMLEHESFDELLNRLQHKVDRHREGDRS